MGFSISSSIPDIDIQLNSARIEYGDQFADIVGRIVEVEFRADPPAGDKIDSDELWGRIIRIADAIYVHFENAGRHDQFTRDCRKLKTAKRKDAARAEFIRKYGEVLPDGVDPESDIARMVINSLYFKPTPLAIGNIIIMINHLIKHINIEASRKERIRVLADILKLYGVEYDAIRDALRRAEMPADSLLGPAGLIQKGGKKPRVLPNKARR